MKRQEFEAILDILCERLTQLLNASIEKMTAKSFEDVVRKTLAEITEERGFDIDLEPPAQEFPDIIYEQEFGIEVKYTESDTWRSIANSIFEGRRNKDVRYIYLLFGKSGGSPEVKWNRYENCIMHVRTSHVPRFEVEIDTTNPLFPRIGIEYDDFRNLPQEEKMPYIREYAKGRLNKGEHLWWIEDNEAEHTLPLEVRLYTKLSQNEKRRYRAEAAVLCPQIIGHGRSRGKYDDATMYLLTYHGILCNQARDLFSAGSVAMRSNQERGGNYLLRALQDIEDEIKSAASYLEDNLFKEYWGYTVPLEDRVAHWLDLLDSYARDWTPSRELLF